MRFFLALLTVLLAGCRGSDTSSPAGSEAAKSPDSQSVDEELDVDLEPSKKTLDEVQAFLKPGLTSDELHEFLKTTPILVRKGRFHWTLRDGSIWTDFEMRPEGAVIINVEADRETP